MIERIGEVAYRLALPPALSRLHDIFHVSMLKKYVHDPSHVLSYESLSVDPKLTYEEKPVEILDRKDKVLRNKTVILVKVLWRNHDVEEATWESMWWWKFGFQPKKPNHEDKSGGSSGRCQMGGKRKNDLGNQGRMGQFEGRQ